MAQIFTHLSLGDFDGEFFDDVFSCFLVKSCHLRRRSCQSGLLDGRLSQVHLDVLFFGLLFHHVVNLVEAFLRQLFQHRRRSRLGRNLQP